MNKQGMYFRQIAMVFYLVMAVVVILTLIQRTKYVISEEDYADAYSKNIALTINSMLYSDYNAEVTFNIPNIFKIDIFENEVKVSISDIEKEYNYIPDKNFKIEITQEKDKIILRKAER